MWRRRIVPPFRRSPLGRGKTPRPIPPHLKEAHRLFVNGNYLEAADIFEDLAEKAYQKQIPQSPQLYLQAGAARLKANEIENGIMLIKKGLQIIIDRQQWGQLKKTNDITIARLRENGLNDQAINLQTWVDKQIPAEVKTTPVWLSNPSKINQAAQLPKQCLSCGGPVNPKEVDWFGSDAICIYCGSLLTGN